MNKMEIGFAGLKANFCNGYNHIKMLSAEHFDKDDLKVITDFERQIAEYTRQIYECLYVDKQDEVKKEAEKIIENVTFLLKDGTEKVVSEDMILEMEMKYKKTGVNVRKEIQKMSVWTHDKRNADNRKTSRGTKAFITNWLNKATKKTVRG